MTTQQISIKCSRCLGTGVDNNIVPSVPCEACLGKGFIDDAVIDNTEIMNEFDWIKVKIKKIMKKLDITE